MRPRVDAAPSGVQRAGARAGTAGPGPAAGRRFRLSFGLAAACLCLRFAARDGQFRIGGRFRPASLNSMAPLARGLVLALQYFTRVPIPAAVARWTGFSPELQRASLA